jgi:hypothetical protein
MFSQVSPGLTTSDILLSAVLILMIITGCWLYQLQKKHLQHYRFFLPAVIVRLAGTLLFCCIYVYHYKDGDALFYFRSSKLISHLLYSEPFTFLKLIFSNEISFDDLAKLDSHEGYLLLLKDNYSFFFVRLITILNLISFGNFMACSILLSVICFSGSWKLYTVFCERFPNLNKELAIAIFFFPSVLFWSGGLLKDTVTLSAVGWFIYSLYRLLEGKRTTRIFINFPISILILVFIKPYILYALITACSMWVAAQYIRTLPIKLERYIYAPVIILLFSFLSVTLIYNLANEESRFSVQKAQHFLAMKQANTKSTSSFETPAVGNSFASVTKWFFSNINVTLFRPYFWEAKNEMMKGAAIENVFLIIFLIWLLLRYRVIFIFRQIFTDPLLIFSFFFVITLSLIVGFSTDNFGTLDRFRIPILPFYLAICFVLKDHLKTQVKFGHDRSIPN